METASNVSQGPKSSDRTATLQSGKGTTTIADTVVAKIAGLAAREIDGVHALKAAGTGGTIADFASKVAGGDERNSGVSVEVGEREAAIDLGMTVKYEVDIPKVAQAVRQNVISRVNSMTGLSVTEVNIMVIDLFFPEDEQAAANRVK